MNDVEVQPTQTRPKSTAPLMLLLVLIAVVVIIAVVVFLRGGAGAWDPAAYLPKEVAMAVTVDLSKSADKDAAIDFIEGIFRDAGVKDPQGEMFKNLSEALEIDVEKDVIRRLNGTGALALLTEMSGMMPGMAVVIGGKSEADAKALTDLIDKKMRENDLKATQGKAEGTAYRAYPAGYFQVYVAASANAVLVTNSESSLKEMIKGGNGGPSLATDPDFARLRKMDSTTFSNAYFSGTGYYKLLGPFLSMAMAQTPGAADELKKGLEGSYVVGSAHATGDGLTFDMDAVSGKEGTTLDKASTGDLVASAPKDAAVVISGISLDKAIAQMKKQLNMNPMAKQQIDQLLMQARMYLQLDPFTDVLDHLRAMTLYYVPLKQADPDDFPGYINAVLKVDDPAAMRKSLAKLNNAMVVMGKMKIVPGTAAGQKLTIAKSPDGQFALADGIVGDSVVISISGPAVMKGAESAVAAAQAKGPSVATTDRFKLVAKDLNAEASAVSYADIAAIVKTFGSDMPAAERKKADAVFDKIGIVGFSGESKGKASSMKATVPFLKAK